MLFLEDLLVEKIITPYYLLATSWFFSTCKEDFFSKRLGYIISFIGLSIKETHNFDSDNIANLVFYDHLKDIRKEQLEEVNQNDSAGAFSKFSFFDAIGNYIPELYIHEFPVELIENRKVEWSFSYILGSQNALYEKRWEVFTKNMFEKTSLSENDQQILFGEFLIHDWGYMKRYTLEETPYGQFLQKFVQEHAPELNQQK